jgi:hypothetical protein
MLLGQQADDFKTTFSNAEVKCVRKRVVKAKCFFVKAIQIEVRWLGSFFSPCHVSSFNWLGDAENSPYNAKHRIAATCGAIVLPSYGRKMILCFYCIYLPSHK